VGVQLGAQGFDQLPPGVLVATLGSPEQTAFGGRGRGKGMSHLSH
jgi:hypothetical protein